jgi:hypothetical protein
VREWREWGWLLVLGGWLLARPVKAGRLTAKLGGMAGSARWRRYSQMAGSSFWSSSIAELIEASYRLVHSLCNGALLLPSKTTRSNFSTEWIASWSPTIRQQWESAVTEAVKSSSRRSERRPASQSPMFSSMRC